MDLAWAFEDVIARVGRELLHRVDELGRLRGREARAPRASWPCTCAGDYGDDAAAGAKVAAEKRGLKFTDVKTATGQDKQAGAIDAIVSGKPDVVILTTGPTDAAVIVGQAGARGFKGKFIGTSPTWNPGLLKGPAAAGDHGAVPAVRAVAAVRRGHPGPQGDAGGARQRAAAQRRLHRPAGSGRTR